MVADWFSTLMLGLAPSVRVFVPASSQLQVAAVSPKTRPLMARALSSVTVTFDERLRVLKSAVLAAPDAMEPSTQLAVSLQLPFAGEIQMPLPVRSGVALASGELPLVPFVPVAVTT